VSLRRGILIAIFLSLLVVPAYLLASDQPPVPPTTSPDDATSNSGAVDTFDVQKKNTQEVADKVVELCDYTIGKLEVVAKKKGLAGDSLNDFNADLSKVKSTCSSMKASNVTSADSEQVYEQELKQYKANFASMYSSAGEAIATMSRGK